MLDGANSSPFGAVPKMNPDRSISEEKRVAHDQQGINASVLKEAHPPALQPRHRQLARLVLWWRARCPGLKIFLAKQDIAGAFRLVWLEPQDAEFFAGDLPCWPEDVDKVGDEDMEARRAKPKPGASA